MPRRQTGHAIAPRVQRVPLSGCVEATPPLQCNAAFTSIKRSHRFLAWRPANIGSCGGCGMQTGSALCPCAVLIAFARMCREW